VETRNCLKSTRSLPKNIYDSIIFNKTFYWEIRRFVLLRCPTLFAAVHDASNCKLNPDSCFFNEISAKRVDSSVKQVKLHVEIV